MRLWRSGSSQLSCHNQTDQLLDRVPCGTIRRAAGRITHPAPASAFPNASLCESDLKRQRYGHFGVHKWTMALNVSGLGNEA
jgi:hypothetical protein